MKSKPHKPPNYSAIGKRFGADARTVRYWQDAGAPLGNVRALRAWLAARRQTVVETTPDHPSTTANDGQQAGAPQALGRLNAEELATWRKLQRAVAAGDPLKERAARQSWLATCEALRKTDAAIEAARRDAGELRPTSELIDILNRAAHGLKLCGFYAASRVARSTDAATTPGQLSNAMQNAWAENLFTAFAPMFETGGANWFWPHLQRQVFPCEPTEDFAVRFFTYLAAGEYAQGDHPDAKLSDVIQRANELFAAWKTSRNQPTNKEKQQ